VPDRPLLAWSRGASQKRGLSPGRSRPRRVVVDPGSATSVGDRGSRGGVDDASARSPARPGESAHSPRPPVGGGGRCRLGGHVHGRTAAPRVVTDLSFRAPAPLDRACRTLDACRAGPGSRRLAGGDRRLVLGSGMERRPFAGSIRCSAGKAGRELAPVRRPAWSGRADGHTFAGSRCEGRDRGSRRSVPGSRRRPLFRRSAARRDVFRSAAPAERGCGPAGSRHPLVDGRDGAAGRPHSRVVRALAGARAAQSAPSHSGAGGPSSRPPARRRRRP
jgi:hypothetical protein